jgi:hypothetical protein
MLLNFLPQPRRKSYAIQVFAQADLLYDSRPSTLVAIAYGGNDRVKLRRVNSRIASRYLASLYGTNEQIDPRFLTFPQIYIEAISK